MRRYYFFLVVLLAGCRPDNGGSLGSKPKAAFTVTAVSGVANTFAAASTSTNGFAWYWDPGDGSHLAAGQANDTFYYGQKGNYRLTLVVTGQGGYDSSSQIVQVAQDDTGRSVIQNGYLVSSDGWTVLNTGGTQTAFDFSSGGVVLTSSGNSNGAIYQAVQVKGGQRYTFSATVAGSGASNTWLEFYLGTSAPAQGSDYGDNKVYSLNTWAGCGTSPFNGNIVSLGCSGSGPATGAFTWSSDQTIYVVIKGGSSGGSMGSGGITVSDIRLAAPSR